MSSPENAPKGPLLISLKLEVRPDGGLRITSDELPGLLLSGADARHVIGLIAPSVQRLVEARYGVRVGRVTTEGDRAMVDFLEAA